MQVSSKLGYTCTSNEYKWVMKYKHLIIKCASLIVQVQIQVLMKTTSKQVIKTWSTKHKQTWSLG